MKLYFISAIDPDDATYNLDLFVWARNIGRARMFWMQYYERLGQWPENAQVYEVPTKQPKEAGPLRWHIDITDLQSTESK